MMALISSKSELTFPGQEKPPTYVLSKPKNSRCHIVRFTCGDLKLNVFGQTCSVAPERQYEHVIATIDVKVQKRKIFLRQSQVDKIEYKLR